MFESIIGSLLICGVVVLILNFLGWLLEKATELLDTAESVKDKIFGIEYSVDAGTDISPANAGLSHDTHGEVTEQVSIPPFSIQVRNSSKNIGGHPYPSFLIEMKGTTPGQVDGFVTVEMFLHIFDTGADEGDLPLVHSMSSDYNEGLGPAFQFQRHARGGTYYPEWQEIENIPLFHLEFPWQGWRKLKFRLLAMGIENGQNSFRYGECDTWNPNHLYDEVNVVFSHEVTEPGYLD